MNENSSLQSVDHQINNILNMIIYRRKKLGLTQTDLANKLEITLSGYYKIEKGKTDLNFRRMLEIAEILDVDLNYFFK
ncbi:MULTISPECIES: helix-turn-helix domain-containing protein [Polaribacter]|uniref:Helix-turn-helix transcriptional regulator n=1 Tax=Polaribacter marinaquae TaxID=1642819 RepID=A0ABZ2TQK7_9FLAO|nr:helix-turn-helix transcriptional regulator [Polaribacter sp. KT 15]SHM91272.1 DNA-binding transcriptional regulator, XRE-family HTH domain [Polaribacter sp. KT 15]